MLNYKYIEDLDIFEIFSNGRTYYYNDYVNQLSDSKLVSKQRNKYKKKNKRRRLVFLPSNICNLNCTYCFSKNDRTQKELLQFEDIEEYLQDIIRNNGEYPLHIIFTGGGEPTLNFRCIKDIVKKFSICNDVSYHITTNGVFSEDVRQFLIDNNFKIAISIDGDYEIEKLQQDDVLSKETYNIAINNAKYLKKAGQSVVIAVVLSEHVFKRFQENEDELVEKSIGFLANEDFEIISVVFDSGIFYSPPNEELMLSIANFCSYLIRWKQNHKNILVYCPHIYKDNYNFSQVGICEGIQNYPNDIKIMPNGKLSFCNRIQIKDLEYPYEKIDDLKDKLMVNPLFKDALKKAITKKKECIACIARQTCISGVCPASYLTNSDEELEFYCKNNLCLRLHILEKFLI